MRWAWLALGGSALVLAVIGIVLPLLPTVPFLLLAAFAFARSSECLHDWLVNHPVFGPPIADWRRSGAIRPKAKRLATLSVIAVFAISLALQLGPELLAIQAVALIGVLVFIWTRPAA